MNDTADTAANTTDDLVHRTFPEPVPAHPELIRMAEAQAQERKAQARERRERELEKLQADLSARFSEEITEALKSARTEARLYVATARYTERLKSVAPGMGPDEVRRYAATEAIKDADALLEALK